MRRVDARNPRFNCGTRFYTNHYACRDVTVAQSEIERVVLESLKAYAAALVGREELKLAGIRRGQALRAEIEGRLKSEERALSLLDQSVTANYTAFASGRMSKEDFLSKRETVKAAAAQKTAAVERLRGQLTAVTEDKAAVDKRLAELRPLLTLEKLDREIVDLLVDKIIVHGEREIEVVWNGRFEV
jgi:hypothetical protein